MNSKLWMCASLLALSTMAAAEDENTWYTGIGLSQAKFDFNLTDAEQHLPFTDAQGVSLSDDTYDVDTKTTAYQLYFGYRINSHFATELNRYQMADIQRNGDFRLVRGNMAGSTVTSDAEIKTKGVGLSVLGFWPLSSEWDVYGRLGLHHWKLRAPFVLELNSTPIAIDSPTDSGNDVQLGAGVEYHWDAYSIRTEFQRYTFEKPLDAKNDTEANIFSVNFMFNF